FHTYFRVTAIEHVGIRGLTGSVYLDKTRDGREEIEMNEVVRIEQETDRIYVGVQSDIAIRDEAAPRTIVLQRDNLPDAVLWNPWIDWSREHEDFGDDEYRQMVCVESATIERPVRLDPGRS